MPRLILVTGDVKIQAMGRGLAASLGFVVSRMQPPRPGPDDMVLLDLREQSERRSAMLSRWRLEGRSCRIVAIARGCSATKYASLIEMGVGSVIPGNSLRVIELLAKAARAMLED